MFFEQIHDYSTPDRMLFFYKIRNRRHRETFSPRHPKVSRRISLKDHRSSVAARFGHPPTGPPVSLLT